MMRETRNTVAKIECKDRADDGGVVTRGMSCEVDPFCCGGVRSVGVSTRPFPLSTADGDARPFMIVVTGHGSELYPNRDTRQSRVPSGLSR